MWGDAEVLKSRPMVNEYHGCVYVPLRDSIRWGIFDRDGNIVRPSVNFSGPDRQTPGQDISDYNTSEHIQVSYDETFIYIGNLNVHFGHFLIETLPRLWLSLDVAYKDYPLLCHFPAHACINDIPRDYRFASDILEALGIPLGRIHKFDQTCRIEKLLVPDTTFHAQCSVHPRLRELALRVTDGLGVMPRGREQINTPLYISKSRLAAGVNGFADEEIFEDVALRRGVDVYHPQEHSLADQIRELSSRRYIFGTVGSAFHSLLFCPGGRTAVMLNGTQRVNSNYMLMDRVSSTRSIYFYPRDGYVSYRKSDRFHREYKLMKPADTAGEFFKKALNIKRNSFFFPLLG